MDGWKLGSYMDDLVRKKIHLGSEITSIAVWIMAMYLLDVISKDTFLRFKYLFEYSKVIFENPYLYHAKKEWKNPSFETVFEISIKILCQDSKLAGFKSWKEMVAWLNNYGFSEHRAGEVEWIQQILGLDCALFGDELYFVDEDFTLKKINIGTAVGTWKRYNAKVLFFGVEGISKAPCSEEKIILDIAKAKLKIEYDRKRMVLRTIKSEEGQDKAPLLGEFEFIEGVLRTNTYSMADCKIDLKGGSIHEGVAVTTENCGYIVLDLKKRPMFKIHLPGKMDLERLSEIRKAFRLEDEMDVMAVYGRERLVGGKSYEKNN